MPTELHDCVIDRNIVNEKTISQIDNVGLNFFAGLCGKNRGVFVTNPPDGNTYGCIRFPTNFATLAGVDTDAEIVDSNAIVNNLADGSISSKDAVDLLDLFVRYVYTSSAAVESSPYACDLGGVSTLVCKEKEDIPSLADPDGKPIRSVTLAGAFTDASWVTGGKSLSLSEVKDFYTAKDFAEMKELGLNAVQISFPCHHFAGWGHKKAKEVQALEDMLELVEDAGLHAIIVIEGDTTKHIADAAHFGEKNDAVMAMILPSRDEKYFKAARKHASHLPLMIPVNDGNLHLFEAYDKNVYPAIGLDHHYAVGDVASSTSVDDRNKLFYHEALACVARAPLDYATCYGHAAAFVTFGFDLSIDDCILQNDPSKFKDYGQCNRFDETVDSDWWQRHRKSLADRQVFTFEVGLGWSFTAWKLYGDTDEPTGIIDSPTKLMTLRDVAAAGLMPDLQETSPVPLACLDGPTNDFNLGDDTLAPSPGPPPDCGDGWWNYDWGACEYWIPPPPTIAPTESPTVGCHCPSVPSDFATTTMETGSAAFVHNRVGDYATTTNNNAIATATVSGMAIGAILASVIFKFRNGRGYTELP
mmetsp:Transcript_13729/g.15064  ORF Transcript_13729/g.15064 Transcript_13729/m.15064 type:complete len:586 (-) Transcript_13729:179-1936(-)|eukprot:CAMPEP_0195296276 /NCGR_PEP_ID=MMETSP0707-20130614/19105_1 /TAXON_ID=33640 /ORGANISM="Asterionellopsis glacialis, Strain CCMP134" /LENGTH=585 /DNA_ID=CAMNT_0040357739 /DNA_START=151 /DNA_END=1908 /DNA_ORIENTATION=-